MRIVNQMPPFPFMHSWKPSMLLNPSTDFWVVIGWLQIEQWASLNKMYTILNLIKYSVVHAFANNQSIEHVIGDFNNCSSLSVDLPIYLGHHISTPISFSCVSFIGGGATQRKFALCYDLRHTVPIRNVCQNKNGGWSFRYITTHGSCPYLYAHDQRTLPKDTNL